MLELEIKLERIDCPLCGMIMYLPHNFLNIKRRNLQQFFCGAGHKMSFTQPNSENPETLKKTLTTLKSEVTQLRMDKAQLLHKIDQANIE